jgi:hypothetical protein
VRLENANSKRQIYRELYRIPMSAEASMDDEHSENLARTTEQRLRESEEHLRLALEAGQMGTWKGDAGTGLITADAAHQAIFGLPPQDQPLAGMLPSPEQQRTPCPMSRPSTGARCASVFGKRCGILILNSINLSSIEASSGGNIIRFSGSSFTEIAPNLPAARKLS